MRVVRSLESIIHDLKSLPPAKLQVAGDFIHQLTQSSVEDRRAALARTAGVLSAAESEGWIRVIEEGCEKIDERNW